MRQFHEQIFPLDVADGTLTAAIIDPVRLPGLRDELSAADFEWYILYPGPDLSQYGSVTPYMVELQPENIFFSTFLEQLGQGCGIIVQTSTLARGSLTTLAAWFMDLPHAVLAAQEPVWFRYYDPVILHDFWRIANAAQQARIMGGMVEKIFVESQSDPVRLIELAKPATPFLPLTAQVTERLSISADQLEAMDEFYFQRFKMSLATDIIERFYPGREPDTLAWLPAAVEAAILRAETARLIDERQIRRYVEEEITTLGGANSGMNV